MAAHHLLSVEHRTLRYKPSCCCGWEGVPVRSLRAAAGEYHDHVNAVTLEEQASTSKRHRMAPAKVTPAEDLPAVLRDLPT